MRTRVPVGRRDDGQVTILAIGLTVVAMLLVMVVAASAGVHLERTRLLAVADLVALDAADSTTDAAYFADDGSHPGLPLTDASVRAAVTLYLGAHPDAVQGLDDVTVVAADTPDGRSAHVQLSAVAHPRFAGVDMPWRRGIRVDADAVARAS
jgi:uncharacterized membrane protein